ncbi:MAG: asparaginase domain-containing protein, partial [Lysinibacillus sp.]
MKKSILLIHTGGTISMAMSDEGAVMPNKENPLMQESNKLSPLANIIEIEAFNLPSPHITPNEM